MNECGKPGCGILHDEHGHLSEPKTLDEIADLPSAKDWAAAVKAQSHMRVGEKQERCSCGALTMCGAYAEASKIDTMAEAFERGRAEERKALREIVRERMPNHCRCFCEACYLGRGILAAIDARESAPTVCADRAETVEEQEARHNRDRRQLKRERDENWNEPESVPAEPKEGA